ncbi:MAG TPA: hypothetical protein VK203_12420 [Nostocaceae cyanobacterium]|nr:hypothetical protein [Nostocaceae cyanobacterium]
MSTPPSTEYDSSALGDFELDLLKQEYFFLQTTIEDYNKQIWVIKSLGITGTGAVAGFIFQQRSNVTFIATIGCAIPIFFWILESQWKHFQHGFYPRVAEIESIFTNTYGLSSPKIYRGWTSTFKRSITPKGHSYWLDGLLNPSVFISYVLEIVCLLAIALCFAK